MAEEGVLARQQPLAAVALVLTDCKYHADAKHRAPMDIVPAATRAMTAALLATKIRLLEPDLKVDVNCAATVANDVYAVLHRRSAICSATSTSSSSSSSSTSNSNAVEQRFVSIAATLTVRGSIGLVGDLRQSTKGQAFASMQAAGWRLVDSSPFDDGTEANQLVKEARTRAEIDVTIPRSEIFEDRL